MQASVTPSDLILVEQQFRGDASPCEQAIGKVFEYLAVHNILPF